ncbi:General transcription factor IIH subunit 3 [Labeo rohita]|uniref:General transcription factor IIH subunit 3 n=1 Tax=Labeo rohita TaxID=84645 RepID=A0ABQ8MG56_LABRO|nr:General transcription factor IIH subunit 3 [Labeo rohita]
MIFIFIHQLNCFHVYRFRLSVTGTCDAFWVSTVCNKPTTHTVNLSLSLVQSTEGSISVAIACFCHTAFKLTLFVLTVPSKILCKIHPFCKTGIFSVS